jgi:hypothetical protein
MNQHLKNSTPFEIIVIKIIETNSTSLGSPPKKVAYFLNFFIASPT